jgi:hypothetical protein
MNIKLIPYNHKADWILKSWKVYSGKFYLGTIYKREVGMGTVIRTGKRKSIGYQCQILLFTGEGMGLNQTPIHKITDLKLAKKEFKKQYRRLVTELTRED